MARVRYESTETLFPAEDELLASCRRVAAGLPALAHLSLLANGDWRFSVNQVGAQTPTRTPLAAEAAADLFRHLHDTLQVARTGALIRLVLDTPRGALIAHALPRRGHLVGFALTGNRADVAEADRALSEVADQARAADALGTQNPGGWRTAGRPPTTLTSEAAPVVTGLVDDQVVEACRAAVDDVLPYVLCLGAEGSGFSVDHFDHLDLGRPDSSPGRRRQVYRSLVDDLETDLRDLRRMVYPVLGRHAGTVALDVEDGAVFVRWLPGGRQLLGVTVNQDDVHAAEKVFTRLGDSLAGG